MSSRASHQPSTRVLILSAPEGHKSLALAAKDILDEKKIATEVFVYEEAVLKIYRLFYHFAPKWFSFWFNVFNNNLISRIANWYLRWHHGNRLKKLLAERQPTHVLCTAFSFTPAIEANQKRFKFKFINIFPNTTTFFKADVAETADANLVLDNRVANLVKEVKPQAQVVESGWLVRSAFKPLANQAAINQQKRELGLDAKLPVFLFSTGSEGTQAILDTIVSFVSQNKSPIQLVVACGHNQRLKNKLETLDQLMPQTKIIALPFTKKLHLYLQVADLAVGKAGPNSVFEAVATHTPFLVTTHIGGLEDGVLETIKHYQIGEIAEQPDRAVFALLKFAQNPDQLKKYLPSLKKLASHNQQAGKVLLSLM